MGVINVTPDSFSDGSRLLDFNQAAAAVLRLADEGADLIDIGGESTRPGAKPVPTQTEWQRIEPLLAKLATRKIGAILSIDTRKPSIMLQAVEMGVGFINDSSGTADGRSPLDSMNGGADDETLAKLARYESTHYCAMHMHGIPETMQNKPLSGHAAVAEVSTFFEKAATRLQRAGFARHQIWFDPGIGFGKDDSANMSLMAEIPEWSRTHQLAVGISRKGFLGRTLEIPNPLDRDGPSKMLELGLAIAGAKLIRTHDVSRLAKIRALWRGGES